MALATAARGCSYSEELFSGKRNDTKDRSGLGHFTPPGCSCPQQCRGLRQPSKGLLGQRTRRLGLAEKPREVLMELTVVVPASAAIGENPRGPKSPVGMDFRT